MAKKRKTRSSEAEPQTPAAESAQAPSDDKSEPSPHPVEEPLTMAVDESVSEIPTQIQEEAVEDELPRQEEDENGEKQLEDAAGSGSSSALENGAEAEIEEEDDDDDEEPLDKLLEPFSKDQLIAIIRKAVGKHADVMEEVREIAEEDPVHRKIFVHGLGWDTTSEILTSVFEKYGEIQECKHVTDKASGKSKGYAFILFKLRKGARKALKQPQKKIGNRTSSCQLASTGPVPAPPPSAPPVFEYTQKKIFVSNVSAEVDPGKLLEYFRQFGEIEEGPLGLDKQTGKPKGFALFVYKSVESARKALEEPQKNFFGRTLYCQKAVDGPKHGKPGFGGPHNQNHQYNNPHFQAPRKEKNKYGGGGGSGVAAGHMMASGGPPVGYNPGPVHPQGINPMLGQALTAALLATQGGGLGFGNYLGGIGNASMNQGGMPMPYGSQPDAGYAMQPGMQTLPGGYQQPPMGGQGSMVRPPQGGPPYTGH
ncbi:hypothetical protein SAY86_023751 [Trapa natans]|uniref:RRM domain-containing protein n=1 Tax=Trapa natans TaxID=22666 RepID=A0AAN7LV02_TRANT|nr:hypothetical protein SAY86_023751 [Trapa natans]